MGGSGSAGDYLSAHDAEDLRAEAQRRLARGRLDAEVNAMLQQELMTINDRDVEQVNRYLEAIEFALGDRIGEVDRLLFGGSVAKHTYVDGLSDIDALVLLSEVSPATSRPAEVRSQFAQALRQVLPHGNVLEVREGTVAVTVVYRDGTEIQLLPAIRDRGRMAVSSWDGKSWSATSPTNFTKELTDVNQRQGSAVVPTIKLAKSILASKLGDVGLSGYHVEALAVSAFRDYSGPRTPKAMLTHLVSQSSRDVMHPIRDVTGQSRHIDESLGPRNSSARQTLARMLEGIARNMEKARSVNEWREMLY